jgi:hypothetical protein
MSKLVILNQIQDGEQLDKILDSPISVFEDIQGSKILVNWDGKKFTLKPKSLSYDPLNLVDLAIQNYYNKAFDFFENLDKRVKALLNKRWWFVFEYFTDNHPANIHYTRTPKNNLVLTSIIKGRDYNYSFEELEEYSRLFDVDVIPLIFSGKLSQKTKEAIKYFLNTSPEDLEYVFGEKSFAFFFYKILNPSTTNSFLMQDQFQNNLERLILKSGDTQLTFSILNPLYKKEAESHSTEFIEVYTLILVNFLSFCQSIDLDEIKLKASSREESYIELICKLFNSYISEVASDITSFKFVIPHFFNKDKFKINRELIRDNLTKSLLVKDPKIEYIFKVVLGSFNKKKKKPMGVFNNNTLILFNSYVDTIQQRVNNHLKRKSEVELVKKGLLDFSDYFDIKYDTDSQGNVYPDVYKEFERGRDEKGDKSKGLSKFSKDIEQGSKPSPV